MLTKEIVQKVIDRLKTPGVWVQHKPEPHQVDQDCLVTALWGEGVNNKEFVPLFNALLARHFEWKGSIAGFNDHPETKLVDILRLLRLAHASL